MTLRRRFGLALGVVLAPVSLTALGACVGSTIVAEAPAGGVSVTGDQIVLGGARGFAAAELVYSIAAEQATRLAQNGAVRGDAATRLRTLNAKARQILIAGKATVDMAAKARAAAELFGIVDGIDGIRAGR